MPLPTRPGLGVPALLALFLTCFFTPATAQTAVIGLRVFGDINFKGATAALVRDWPDLPASMARAISSVQVASGEVWEICTGSRYAGRCRTVNEDIDDLRKGGWNDTIASARRLRGQGARFFGPGPGRPSASGLQIFGDINFKGSSATLTSNAPDLSDQGMARAISSVRLDPDEVWEVCSDTNFRGRCQVIREDQSDLRRGNWNDVIMSARRVRSGPSSGSGIVAGGLQVFADINFRGRSASVGASTPDIGFRGVSGISSVRVAPGEVWEVCTETNFRGRCDVIYEDVGDLRRGEWNDAIVSARRVR